MSYELIRGRVRSILEEVEGVHNVHEYIRDIVDEDDFRKAFVVAEADDGDELETLTGWMITRRSTVSDRPDLGTTIVDLTHNLEIQGFLSMVDLEATEIEFQTILDRVIDAFRSRYLLENASGSALAGVVQTGVIDAVEIGHAQFGNQFVHFARLNLSVEERIS